MLNESNSSFILGIWATIAILALFISMLTWPLVAIIITNRFDPQFKSVFKDAMGFGRFLRGFWYASIMTNPTQLRRANSFNDRIFKGYNLWLDATKFERVLACIHIYSAYLSIVMGIIFEVNHLIIYIQHL